MGIWYARSYYCRRCGNIRRYEDQEDGVYDVERIECTGNCDGKTPHEAREP